MVVGRNGVPEGIPEVTWSIGMAPGAPVIVLGGVGVVVVLMVLGLGLGPGLELVVELEVVPVGFCLSARL